MYDIIKIIIRRKFFKSVAILRLLCYYKSRKQTLWSERNGCKIKKTDYDTYPLRSFAEQSVFADEFPYHVIRKEFLNNEVVPLHYAQSFELLLCENLIGEVVVEDKHYTFNGKQVILIPPGIIHSITKKKCDGSMFVFQISFEKMAKYIDIKSILSYCHCSVSDLMYAKPKYDEVSEIIQKLREKDDNIYRKMENILSLFEILEKAVLDCDRVQLESSDFNTPVFKKLISWTEENYNTKITIEQAAKQIGFSKYYFCSFFKAKTGLTYLSYLNQVRMHRALSMLRENNSVGDVCFECGFDNLSYFIQLFKKINGYTPKEYQQLLSRNNQ